MPIWSMSRRPRIGRGGSACSAPPSASASCSARFWAAIWRGSACGCRSWSPPGWRSPTPSTASSSCRSPCRAHGGLGRFASMNFLLQLQQNVWPMVYVLYVSHRYHWTSAVTGLVMMISGVAGIGVQMGLVGPVVRRIGERGAVVLGVSFGAIGMTIYGWAPTSLIYFVGLPFNVLAGFAIPGLMALMTNRVGMAEQGQLQGANQALVGIASIVGPLVYGPIFAWALTTEAALHEPGAPFYVAGLAYVGVLLLSFGVRRRPALQPA